jgi:glycosyltransferase involved in cell wall biosynthesis
MRALQVLHVIGGGDTGGAMSHLLPLLSALARAGCDVSLLCLGEGGLAQGARARGLPVAVLPMSGPRDPRVLRPLRRVLTSGPPGFEAGRALVAQSSPRWDVVHTHGMRANLPLRLVVPSLKQRPCLFTTVHSDLRTDYSLAALARTYEASDRLTLGVVDQVICVSDALRALLIGRGYPAERLLTIRSGLEAESWTIPASPDGRGRGERAPRRLRIGTVARLVAVKDIDLMLEVAGLLRRTHPQLEVIIAGDGPERERLEAHAADAGMAGVVRLVGRLDDVGPLLGALDVYMVTSTFEGGVSMAVLEAMAGGLPVVTTAAGGVAEAVVDGETGYVVGRDTERGALVAKLAERAAALLDDPALRARMGAAGAERVRARFTVQETAVRTVRAYERCLAAKADRF